MNIQKFLNNGQNRFPLSTDTLDFMQNQTLLLQDLTQAFGNNYIIKQPTTAGEGLIVINGELLPFQFGSGSASKFIAVFTDTSDIDANGLIFTKIRTKRHAQYVSTDQGSECYEKTDFFEIRKQQAIPIERGAHAVTVYLGRMKYPTDKTRPLNVQVEPGGVFNICGFFKPNIPAGNFNYQKIGSLPNVFPKPKYPIVVQAMGVGYYGLVQNMQQPYSLRIMTDGSIQLFMASGSVQDWLWVNARIDMLRYF